MPTLTIEELEATLEESLASVSTGERIVVLLDDPLASGYADSDSD